MNSSAIEYEFDQTVKNMGLGDRLDLTSKELASEFKETLLTHKERADYLIASMNKSQLVHFDYIDNPHLNAVAFIGDHNFIGLNFGTIIIIYDYYFRLLADPSLFQDVGNALAEKTSSREASSPLAKKPNDPYRRALAVHFAWHAIDFIVVHEVAHLLNGHVGLLKELTTCSFLEELVSLDDSALALTRQTLEMDVQPIGSGPLC